VAFVRAAGTLGPAIASSPLRSSSPGRAHILSPQGFEQSTDAGKSLHLRQVLSHLELIICSALAGRHLGGVQLIDAVPTTSSSWELPRTPRRHCDVRMLLNVLLYGTGEQPQRADTSIMAVPA
jgi:hypothetical protein